MCGIAGIAGEHPDVIRRMTDALRHRGPDGNAVWIGNGASLGHARLAILDPRPEGDQPMWNDDHTIGIVYNGEIYNYRELRDAEGLTCCTSTDTEVLLRLFEKHGMEFVHRLRGMFAFGIYDSRVRTWYLARDTGGIKPIYVAYPNGSLAFSSEMRSLMTALPSKPALNMRSLSRYLRLQYVPGPETLCEGIEQLPPGTILSWQEGREKRQSFTPRESASFRSKREFVEQFPEMMDAVVAQHLVSDKPVGIFLSGGIDSSILLHHMCRHVTGPVKTFTVRFDATDEEGAGKFNADADNALITAKHYGTNHREIFLSAETFRQLYRMTAKALDQPNANAVAIAQFLLSQEAKKHADVVLAGAGGDELFGGYPRYRLVQILHACRRIPRSIRALGARMTHLPTDVVRLPPGSALAERLLARPATEGAAVTRGGWFDPEATTAYFADRFQEASEQHPVRAMMELDRKIWLVDEALRLTDATTMSSGLECRVPFVDERILAASRAVPVRWLLGMRQTKVLLRDTYRTLLPPHLFSLKKSGFFPPFAKWIRREAWPLAEEALAHPRIQSLFDADALRTLAEDHRAKRGYHLHILGTIIQLHNWFDTIYDA